MKRSLSVLIVLLAASATLPAADAPADGLKAVLAKQSDAWNKGDLDGFLETYWKSDDLVFFSGGTASKGHKAVSERYHKRYKADGKEMGKLTFTDLEVEMLGADAALARGRWKLAFEKSEDKPEGLFTLVLKKTADGWKIVHDHTSTGTASGDTTKKESDKK